MLLLVVGAVSGAPMRDLLRRSRHFTRGCTDEKALYTGSTWGQFGGGGGGGEAEVCCIQCVVSLGPAEETS